MHCRVPFDTATPAQVVRALGRKQSDKRAGCSDAPIRQFADPTSLSLADIGNFRIALGDIAATMSIVESRARDISHLIALGGDHSVTLPLLRALAGRVGPLALVHFDAHVDTWPENFGQAYAHGSVFYHAIKEGLVDPRRMIQIGIRSPVEREVFEWTRGQGVTIVSAHEVHEAGPRAVADRVGTVIGGGSAYLTFDIDALDPAFARPAPEIGGLAS